MATVPVLIENHTIGSAASVRNSSVTAAVSTATGYDADAAQDEVYDHPWRTSDDSPANTRALVRCGGKRSVLGAAVGRHSLSRHGTWRVTADDEYAERGALDFDGVDDTASTSTAIPSDASGDLGWYLRLWLRPQPVAHNTANIVLATLTGAGGDRIHLALTAGNDVGANPWGLRVIVYNESTPVILDVAAAPEPDGRPYDVIVGYRDSDQRTELWVAGVSLGSVTASAVWPGGNNALTLGSHSGVFSCATIQDVRILGRFPTAADVAGYRAEEVPDTYRDLLGAWHMVDSGATESDVAGNADLTITGATRVERVNPSPRWSTGVLEAWGPWQRRQALRLTAGAYATSPVLGNSERSYTIAFTIEAPDTYAETSGGLVWVGPSIAANEIAVALLSTGVIEVSTTRGVVAALTSTSIAGTGPRPVRAVLDGRENEMSLYMAPDPDSAEVLIGTRTGLSAFATVASAMIEIGNSAGTSAEAKITGLRVYSEIRLEADDPHGAEAAPVDPEAMAVIPLQGTVTNAVDTSQAWTLSSPAATYVEMERGSVVGPPAADQRLRDTAAPLAGYPKRLIATVATAVEAEEALFEFFDVDGPGYLEVGALFVYAGWRSPRGRLRDASQVYEPVNVGTTASGGTFLVENADRDGATVHFEENRADGEGRAAIARIRAVLAEDPTRKFCLVLDDAAEMWELGTEEAVIGRIEIVELPEGLGGYFHTITLQVIGEI